MRTRVRFLAGRWWLRFSVDDDVVAETVYWADKLPKGATGPTHLDASTK